MYRVHELKLKQTTENPLCMWAKTEIFKFENVKWETNTERQFKEENELKNYLTNSTRR